MVRRISGIILAACFVAATVRAEEPKCTASARDCDQQIRQMLSGRRFLGVTVEEQASGLVIRAVVPNSPAARAGLKVGDRLIAVNGKSLVQANTREFKQTIADARETGRVRMIIWRRGAYTMVDTRLEPYSKEQVDKIVAAHLAQSHPKTAGGD
jgi:predicted metalloprotease with PDZ domain